MGEVYRADDLKLGHTVALKFLPKDLANDPQRLEYFHSEVRLTRQISHPNVCRVYDIGEVDGQHFLSMEYIDGEDLKGLLRRIGRLPNDKGVEIARQLCAGLAAAHGKGVLHRDLKPANIMLDGRGQVRITDFGLAKLAEEDAVGEVAGTPAYMAPEQLARGEATVQSDLYSLGLMLYELFTGEPVHRSTSIQELLRLHGESSLSQPSDLIGDIMDPDVERVILRCLEKQPHERPKSALAVATALPGGDPLAAALAAGETPSPEMVANAGTSERMSLRAGLTWLAALLCGLIAAGLLASKTSVLATADFTIPSDTLKVRCTDYLEAFGYAPKDYPATSSAFGFEQERSTDGWLISFWYRQSSTRMVPEKGLAWMLTYDDPVPAHPTMLAVRLAAEDARLLEFRAVPVIDPDSKRPRISTSKELIEKPEDVFIDFFEHAKLDWANRQVVKPNWYPLMRADEHFAWRTRSTNSDHSHEVIVRAACDRGCPVFFEASRKAITPKAPSVVVDAKRLRYEPESIQTIMWVLQLVMLFASIPLARWNLRVGRCDRKTGFRLAQLTFLLYMASWLLEADHVAFLKGEVTLLLSGLMWAVFLSGIWWLGYLAIEPFVRRFWPDSLITWNRVFAGRYNDPLVGRDLLMGATVGIFSWPCLTMLAICLREQLGSPFAAWYVQRPTTLLAPTHVIAQLLHCLNDAVIMGLYYLFSMFLIRLVFRRPLASCLAFMILWGATYSLYVVHDQGGDPVNVMIMVLTFAVMAAVWATLLTRLGLLAFVAGLFSSYLLDGFPITANLFAWYGWTSLFAMAAILVVGVYGFYASALAGRQLFADPLMVRR